MDGSENPFASGDYSLEIDGKTLTVPNYTPRAVTDSSSLTFPIIKVNVSGDEAGSFDFKWMARDPGETTYRATTTDELELLFEASERAYGLASFQTKVGDVKTRDAVSCHVPYGSATGKVKFSDCHKKDGVALPLKWSEVDIISAGTQDAFDFTVRYFLSRNPEDS